MLVVADQYCFGRQGFVVADCYYHHPGIVEGIPVQFAVAPALGVPLAEFSLLLFVGEWQKTNPVIPVTTTVVLAIEVATVWTVVVVVVVI